MSNQNNSRGESPRPELEGMINPAYKMASIWVVAHRENQTKPWLISDPMTFLEAESRYKLHAGLYGTQNTEMFIRVPVGANITLNPAFWLEAKIKEGTGE